MKLTAKQWGYYFWLQALGDNGCVLQRRNNILLKSPWYILICASILIQTSTQKTVPTYSPRIVLMRAVHVSHFTDLTLSAGTIDPFYAHQLPHYIV